VTMKFKQLSKGSRVLAYEIEENNTDLNYLFPQSDNFGKDDKSKDFRWEMFRVYDTDGNYCAGSGYGTSGTYDPANGIYDQIIILDERPSGNIGKITIGRLTVRTNFLINNPAVESVENGYTCYKDGTNLTYADVEIPIPADGKTIEYPESLVLYDHNGITCTIDRIKRDGNTLFIDSKSFNQYKGPGEEYIKNVLVHFCGDNIGSSVGSWAITPEATLKEREPYGDYVCGISFNLTDEELQHDSILLSVGNIAYNIQYNIDGNWEINFSS